MISFIRQFVRRLGFDVIRYHPPSADPIPSDFDQTITTIINQVRPFTLTSPERLLALYEAVRYIVANKIPGSIVECGVWKGGSMMAVAYTLKQLADFDRHLYLFDTFEGMPLPSTVDVDITGASASELLRSHKKADPASAWCYVQLDEVKEAVESVGYSRDKVHFVKGMVEETIPDYAPETIALLRLDTDWYESTRHELIHLFPRISHGGVIIIDDYGHWKGARCAVDEYIRENKIKLLLNRIDYTGRIGVVLKND